MQKKVKTFVAVAFGVLLLNMVSLPIMGVYADTGYARDRFGNVIQLNYSSNSYGSRLTWRCTPATVSIGASDGVSLGLQVACFKIDRVSVNVHYYYNGRECDSSYSGYYGSSYASGSLTFPSGAKNVVATCRATFKIWVPIGGAANTILYYLYPPSTFSATSYY